MAQGPEHGRVALADVRALSERRCPIGDPGCGGPRTRTVITLVVQPVRAGTPHCGEGWAVCGVAQFYHNLYEIFSDPDHITIGSDGSPSERNRTVIRIRRSVQRTSMSDSGVFGAHSPRCAGRPHGEAALSPKHSCGVCRVIVLGPMPDLPEPTEAEAGISKSVVKVLSITRMGRVSSAAVCREVWSASKRELSFSIGVSCHGACRGLRRRTAHRRATHRRHSHTALWARRPDHAPHRSFSSWWAVP